MKTEIVKKITNRMSKNTSDLEKKVQNMQKKELKQMVLQ